MKERFLRVHNELSAPFRAQDTTKATDFVWLPAIIRGLLKFSGSESWEELKQRREKERFE